MLGLFLPVTLGDRGRLIELGLSQGLLLLEVLVCGCEGSW